MVPFMITNSPGVLHEYSFNEPQKDERLSQPLSHQTILKTTTLQLRHKMAIKI